MMNGNGAEHSENINHCVQIESSSDELTTTVEHNISELHDREEILKLLKKLGIGRGDHEIQNQVKRVVEDYKLKLDLREALDKVVTRFQNRLLVFVGYLGVFYTVTYPCEMRTIFAYLIGLGWMGITLSGGLAMFHFWAIYKDEMRRKDLDQNLNNTKKKGGSRSQTNIGLQLSEESRAGELVVDSNVVSSDIENEENCCHQFSAFWGYARLYVIDIIMMLIFALAFVLILGIYIYTKKCVDSISPTPTPVSSDDMLFPIA